MIQVYYGDGKGKTSAAVGAAVRAAGRGMTVLFVQFLKNGDSGERKILEQIGEITLTPCPLNLEFTFNMTQSEKVQASKIFREMFERSVKTALVSNYNMLILDEALTAVQTGMLVESEVCDFLTDAPPRLEIILTGRSLPPKIAGIADYVSRIIKEKHPYDKGARARIGVEL